MTQAATSQRAVRKSETNTAPHGAHRIPARRAEPEGRRVREAYHAITDQALKVGVIRRSPGQALCGAPGPWADIPDGLFPPLVTCRPCQHITTRLHITITGGMP